MSYKAVAATMFDFIANSFKNTGLVESKFILRGIFACYKVTEYTFYMTVTFTDFFYEHRNFRYRKPEAVHTRFNFYMNRECGYIFFSQEQIKMMQDIQ